MDPAEHRNIWVQEAADSWDDPAAIETLRSELRGKINCADAEYERFNNLPHKEVVRWEIDHYTELARALREAWKILTFRLVDLPP